MDLDKNLLKGILSCGYKTPTQIQSKVIPIACVGKDVVVMARTGSGKTAAFLVPLFNRLKCHQDEGIRALIVLPTRDLALQTIEFIKKIGKWMNLICSLIIGGESMDDQFLAVLQNPDILVGTPGRILHLLTVMNIKMTRVETVIFDEADRLYEMGFGEDLKHIVRLMPHHQTILVSATLPKTLIHFTSLGMNQPKFVRLDFDAKISEHLRMCNIYARADDKIALLIYLLTRVIGIHEQTVVFTSTRYHSDMVKEALEVAGIRASVAYSKMDEQARQTNLIRFRTRSTRVLVSTDISARGMDIPLLDNVINFNFPTTPKLFVHRVGRVARAGREGVSYSLITREELPHAFELYSFLGKILKIRQNSDDDDSIEVLGSVPQTVICEISTTYNLRKNTNLALFASQIENAEKKLKRFTAKLEWEYVKDAKSIDLSLLPPHTLFKSESAQAFSTLGFTSKSKPIGTGLNKILEASEKLNIIKRTKPSKPTRVQNHVRVNLAEFSGAKIHKHFIDPSFIPYQAKDFKSELGYKIDDVKRELLHTAVDFMPDEMEDLRNTRKRNYKTKWDRKQKKYINVQIPNNCKIKTESGIIIDSAYSTDHYKKWLHKTGLNSVVSSNKIDAECANKVKRYTQQINDIKFSSVNNQHAKRGVKKHKNKKMFKNKPKRR